MSARTPDPRLKAGVVAALIFAFGVVVGVAADRTIASRPIAEPPLPPLTMRDMAQALSLDSAQRARVGAVLDSLRPGIAEAAAQGPDSLQQATRRARQRIAQALPPARRAQFEQWLDARHTHMMEMMRRMGPGMMRPGMMRRGPGRGAMGPGMAPGGPRGGMAPGGPGTGASMRGPGGPPAAVDSPPGASPSGPGRMMGGGMMGGRGGMMGRGMMGGGMMGGRAGGSPPPGSSAAPGSPAGPGGAAGGPPPAGGALPAPDSPGARLVAARCSLCHTTPSPALHTAGQWPGVIKQMRQRMHVLGVGSLSDAEADTVLQYLERYAHQ